MQLKMKMDEFWLLPRAASIATSGKVSVDGTFPELDVEGKLSWMMHRSRGAGAEGLDSLRSMGNGFAHQEGRCPCEGRGRGGAQCHGQHVCGPQGRPELGVPPQGRHSSLRLRRAVAQPPRSAWIRLGGNLHQRQTVLSVLGELATLRGEAVATDSASPSRENGTFTGENYANPRELAHQPIRWVGGAVEIKIGGDVENTAMG